MAPNANVATGGYTITPNSMGLGLFNFKDANDNEIPMQVTVATVFK